MQWRHHFKMFRKKDSWSLQCQRLLAHLYVKIYVLISYWTSVQRQRTLIWEHVALINNALVKLISVRMKQVVWDKCSIKLVQRKAGVVTTISNPTDQEKIQSLLLKTLNHTFTEEQCAHTKFCSQMELEKAIN